LKRTRDVLKGKTTMKSSFFTCLIGGLAVLLSSCGGGNGDMSMPRQTAASVTQSANLPASSYTQSVQAIYIAYFGRPADPNGLANFSAQLSALGLPADIQSINNAYNTNADLRRLVDSFGNSAESAALYSGDNDAFVTAIYNNVLNRAPDVDGKGFWVNAVTNGGLTRPNASLSIMAGALLNSTPQGLQDGKLVNNRLAVGANFTSSLNTPDKVAAYSGNAAAASVRAMLASVDANTDVNGFSATVDATIANLVAAAGPSFDTVRNIVNARCISCHSGGSAPLGIRLDSDAGIHNNAGNIYQQVVVTRFMPLGNATNMTDDERNIIKLWYEAGAK